MTKEIKTVKQLYDYITAKMSPEEALMKLLESASIQYEKLKFDENSPVHPVIIVAMAACDMEWNMIVEKDKENVEGLIIGTPEFIERNLKDGSL